MEQEETRAVRTHEWLYIERYNKNGMPYLRPELYNLKNDPDERNNLSGQDIYLETIKSFSKEICDYFDKYGDPKFNLWTGGKAKSNVSNPQFWQQAWGEEWSTLN